MQSSFTDIKLPQKLDVVFLILLFTVTRSQKSLSNFWEMLKPTHSNNKDTTDSSNSIGNISSSQLLIQCGGYGNLQQIITLLERITHLDQFKAYFTKWKQSWYFAKPDDTNKLLEK